MRQITLTRTKKRIISYEKLLMMIGTGIVAIVGVFVPDPLFRCINIFFIIMVCWEYIAKYTIGKVEEEITLDVVGGELR